MITPTSLAAANAVGVENVQFKTGAEVLPRKIVIIGTYDPLKTSVVDNVPKLVLNADDAGAQFGFGFMVHRLAEKSFLGSQGVETFIIPQPEAGGGAQSAGDIDFTGSTGVLAGTLFLFIAGDVVPVTLSAGISAAAISAAVVAAINADKRLPVTAVVNATPEIADIVSKSEGEWGDGIDISFNLGFGQETPTGVTAAITAMSAGAGTPDIDDALDGLGTGDNQNKDFFTDLIYGYGQVSTVLDKLSDYNGAGNVFVGNYSKTVARPFRTLTGDTAPGSGGLTALLALANSRKLDRTNGVVAVPGSPNHPVEIGALTIGIMAATNNIRAEETYIDKVLSNIIAGALADQWTSDYDSRNIAVTDGVSTTSIKNGVVVLQNLLTFYHPDNVSLTSNGYRSQRNISIIQNLLNAVKLNFDRAKWQGITIVQDVAKVANITSRTKARDVDAVIDDLVALARAFEGLAWIFTSSFTIDELKKDGAVTIRAGGTGFNNFLPVVLSGEGGIFDTVIQFDTSLAIVLG